MFPFICSNPGEADKETANFRRKKTSSPHFSKNFFSFFSHSSCLPRLATRSALFVRRGARTSERSPLSMMALSFLPVGGCSCKSAAAIVSTFVALGFRWGSPEVQLSRPPFHHLIICLPPGNLNFSRCRPSMIHVFDSQFLPTNNSRTSSTAGSSVQIHPLVTLRCQCASNPMGGDL